jgi:putative transposase
MEPYLGKYTIVVMCRVLGVSRAGFDKWRKAPPSQRAQHREVLESAIIKKFSDFKARYGAPRIALELKAEGLPCSHNTVAHIMQNRGIRARNGKGFKYSTFSAAMLNVENNLLQRDFSADKPNQKWTSDITYIWVNNRWLYLATVLDIYSRKIVGWALDTSMTDQLCINALNMAFAQRPIQPGLLIHSDRGVQYRSMRYQDLMRNKGCVISMSRKSNCWDNAVMESFFSRLKVELIYAEEFNSINEAKSAIFEYIEIFYNRQRRHSALGYKSPADFERLCA